MPTIPKTPANVLAGAARIFVGRFGTAVAPVTGTPPSLFQHTAGTPSGLQTGYTEIGYTQGPVTFDYKAEKGEIIPEQSLLPVDTWVKSENAQVSFVAMERVYVAMIAAMDNVGNVSDSTGDLYYTGNGTSILTTIFYTVFFSTVHRDNTAKYSWACLYKAYSPEGIKLAFEKGKETTFNITLKTVADITRNVGDQAYQLKHEQ